MLSQFYSSFQLSQEDIATHSVKNLEAIESYIQRDECALTLINHLLDKASLSPEERLHILNLKLKTNLDCFHAYYNRFQILLPGTPTVKDIEEISRRLFKIKKEINTQLEADPQRSFLKQTEILNAMDMFIGNTLLFIQQSIGPYDKRLSKILTEIDSDFMLRKTTKLEMSKHYVLSLMRIVSNLIEDKELLPDQKIEELNKLILYINTSNFITKVEENITENSLSKFYTNVQKKIDLSYWSFYTSIVGAALLQNCQDEETVEQARRHLKLFKTLPRSTPINEYQFACFENMTGKQNVLLNFFKKYPNLTSEESILKRMEDSFFQEEDPIPSVTPPPPSSKASKKKKKKKNSSTPIIEPIPTIKESEPGTVQNDPRTEDNFPLSESSNNLSSNAYAEEPPQEKDIEETKTQEDPSLTKRTEEPLAPNPSSSSAAYAEGYEPSQEEKTEELIADYLKSPKQKRKEKGRRPIQPINNPPSDQSEKKEAVISDSQTLTPIHFSTTKFIEYVDNELAHRSNCRLTRDEVIKYFKALGCHEMHFKGSHNIINLGQFNFLLYGGTNINTAKGSISLPPWEGHNIKPYVMNIIISARNQIVAARNEELHKQQTPSNKRDSNNKPNGGGGKKRK